MYRYRVSNIAKMVDGDTYDFDLDLGFYASLRIRVRLEGVDTYEMYGKNAHPLGPVARDYAERWMQERLIKGNLCVRTYKLTPGTPVPDGVFGRWLGSVYDENDGELLSDYLLAENMDKDSPEPVV